MLIKSESRLMELMNAVFGAFTRVLQNHIDIWSTHSLPAKVSKVPSKSLLSDIIRHKHDAKNRKRTQERQERLASPPVPPEEEEEEDDDVLFGRIRTSDLNLGAFDDDPVNKGRSFERYEICTCQLILGSPGYKKNENKNINPRIALGLYGSLCRRNSEKCSANIGK